MLLIWALALAGLTTPQLRVVVNVPAYRLEAFVGDSVVMTMRVAPGMSTRGRGASRLLIGSVADKVLRGSGLPTLLHRPISVAEPMERVARPITEGLSYCI